MNVDSTPQMTSRHHTTVKRTRRAFTLIEIMVVVAIGVVLAGTAAYFMVGNLETSKAARVDADINSITIQLRTYEIGNLTLPTTEQGLAALVNPPTTEPLPRRWTQLFTTVPKDPWGQPYQYRRPGKFLTNSFDVYSLGPDGVESADDLGNWQK